MIRGFTRLLTVIFFIVAGSVQAAALQDINVVNSAEQATVSLLFDSQPMYAFSTLQNPERVVIDVRQTGKSVSGLPLTFSGSNLIKKIRDSKPLDNQSIRLVFELKEKARPRAITKQQGGLYQVVFTMTAEQASRSQVKNVAKSEPVSVPQTGKVNSTVKARQNNVVYFEESSEKIPVASTASTRTTKTTIPKRNAVGEKIIIAIDAGHGGQDPGAIGPDGLKEKIVTLAISRKLKALLDKDPMFKGVLTRDGDYFISVMGRSDVARKKSAHLLVSVHADAAPNRSATGASVWVLSNRRANSELGRWLEQHEKQSELLGGAGDVLSNEVDPYLSQTVLDLQFGHSQRVGYDVAVNVLKQLRGVGSLHKGTPEHASLGVLRSPDIPSLLVETGFISNHTEERLLGSDAFQQKIAQAIYQGIRSYFLSNPIQAVPESSAPSTQPQKRQRSEMSSYSVQSASAVTSGPTHIHIVKKGESLSGIAASYNTTASRLYQMNNLKKEGVWTGQRLKVPATSANRSAAVSKRTAVTRHKVKQGDSLSMIAARYGVTMTALKSANNLSSNTAILGQTLTIPGQ